MKNPLTTQEVFDQNFPSLTRKQRLFLRQSIQLQRRDKVTKPYSMSRILYTACQLNQCNYKTVLKTRIKDRVTVRTMAIAYMELKGFSRYQIQSFMELDCHSSVGNSIKRHKDYLDTSTHYFDMYEELKDRLSH